MTAARSPKSARALSTLLTVSMASLSLLGCNLEEESISGPVGLQAEPAVRLPPAEASSRAERKQAQASPSRLQRSAA